jgi:hypothetical protein
VAIPCTKFHPNRPRNVGGEVRNSFTPLSKWRHALSQFWRNSPSLDKRFDGWYTVTDRRTSMDSTSGVLPLVHKERLKLTRVIWNPGAVGGREQSEQDSTNTVQPVGAAEVPWTPPAQYWRPQRIRKRTCLWSTRSPYGRKNHALD